MSDPTTARLVLLDETAIPPGWNWTAIAAGLLADPTRPAHPGRPTAPDGPPGAAPGLSDSEQLLGQVATKFARALAETLDGRRRLSQLESSFDAASLQALSLRLANHKGTRVRLGSVRVQPLGEHSAEVALRLVTPHSSYAAALRVTQRGGRWRCSDLVLG